MAQKSFEIYAHMGFSNDWWKKYGLLKTYVWLSILLY